MLTQTVKMTRRRLLLILIAFLPSVGACDVYYLAHARTPLVAPVDTACLRMRLAENRRIGRNEPRRVESPSGSAVVYGPTGMFTHNWENVAQTIRRDSSLHGGIMYRDSTIMLAVLEIRINRAFASTEAPLTAAAMSNFILQVGDACGAQRPAAERLYVAEVTEHPYRAAIVHGTAGRVRMRLTVEDRERTLVVTRREGRYRLHADTLVTDSDPRAPRWLEADTLALPPLPKGQLFETGCWRGDSLPSGNLVALIRLSYDDYFPKVFDAWAFDRSAWRLRRVDVEGIACTTPKSNHYDVIAPRSLRSVALTFKPTPGLARIYAHVSKPDLSPSGAFRFALDGQVVGRMDAGSFLMIEVPPGRYRVSSPSRPKEPSLEIDMAADSVYYLDIQDRRGMLTRTTLRLMNPAEAQSAIRRAPMAPIYWRGLTR